MPSDLLILDLDEALIYSAEAPLERAEDFHAGAYHSYLRPHARDFLQQISLTFQLAVWTSASADYATAVVRFLFEGIASPEFVWSSNRCTRRIDRETLEYYWVKDLRKVKRRGHPLERVLMIDDSPEKLERHYGNHLRVNPFVGDITDCELVSLVGYLRWLQKAENFRRIEKRGWINHPACAFDRGL